MMVLKSAFCAEYFKEHHISSTARSLITGFFFVLESCYQQCWYLGFWVSVANPEGKYLELLFFGISHYWLLPEEKDVLHAWLWLGVCVLPRHGHQHPAGCGKSRGLVDEGLMCGNRRCNVHLRNAGVGTELAGSEQFSLLLCCILWWLTVLELKLLFWILLASIVQDRTNYE